jgi:hypothetical protein
MRATVGLLHYSYHFSRPHRLELLPKRARIFTTSRSIVLWGKKEKTGWWLRRVNLNSTPLSQNRELTWSPVAQNLFAPYASEQSHG